MGSVSDDQQVEALNQLVGRYATWLHAQERLHREMSHASDTSGPLPVEALQADFAAQRDLTRGAVAFARTCGSQGPDPDGAAGPAFVHALYQASAGPGVEAELDELDDAMGAWWPLLRVWTPAKGQPPPRPDSDAHRRILDALTNWREFLDERANDWLIESLASEGAEVTQSLVRDADGAVMTYTTARLDLGPRDDEQAGHPPPPVGTLRRDGALAGHLAGLWRPPLQVLARGRDGQTRPLSVHWSASRAYRSAHHARTEITPQSWVELWEWTFRGFKLLDSLPWMDSSDVDDNGDGLIFGVLGQRGDIADVGVIGVIRPGSRGWSIMVRDQRAETFRTPRLRDWIYLTRAQAIAGVEKLFESQRGE